MEEAERLCARLAIMDGASSPREARAELISANRTHVVEVHGDGV